MRHESLVRLGLLVLLGLWPWHSALADTPGTCSNTTSDCTVTCSSAGPCNVTISRAGLGVNPATVLVNGTAASVFCVAPGTNVTWAPADATSFADIRFSSSSPFGKSSFGPDSANSFSSPASNSGAYSVCYTFSVSECTYDTTQCAHSDPKVVIQSSSPQPYHHHHHHHAQSTPPSS
jgi:hypothetical protein